VTVPGPGGPIFVPGPGGGAPPVTGPAPPSAALITLRPGAANLTNGANVADLAVLPTIRFRRNSAATFTFSVPAGASAFGPRLRLQWGFFRNAPTAEIALTWEVTLRLHGAGDDLLAPGALPPVAINAQTPAAQENRLQTTAFVPLPPPPSAQPALGVATVTLRTAANLPGQLEVHLIVADLDLAGGL
jgi:hypothetical protein